MALLEIAGIRHPYHDLHSTFDIKDLMSKNPFHQFQAWFNEAKDHKSILEPNAMAIATATKSGIPSVRMVLCKGYSEKGFVFFTNYDSRKGKELLENPHVSLMFYWEPIKRSVRIEGVAEKLSEEESRQYFDMRPRDSQIGALVSHQSSVIPDRQFINDKNEALKTKYSNESVPIPKPDYWGGYLVRPKCYEYWQGQTNRLHDRLQFRLLEAGEEFNSELMVKAEGDWVIERLSP